MSFFQPRSVEYTIVHGRISIVLDTGRQLPAYWSHPDTGGKFPAIAIIHDWWGITATERRMANLFAQSGYYTIIPDLFDGQVATTPHDAIRLVEAFRAGAYDSVHSSLQALEAHVRVNGMVAAVGLGMGGTFALEAALTRKDLEAAVALYGFPQKHLGKFKDAYAPILAIFGDADPYVGGGVIAQLTRELLHSKLTHEIVTLEGAGHGFFKPEASGASAQAWAHIMPFIDKHLKRVE